MRFAPRFILPLSLACGLPLLSGCGGPPVAVKSAKSEIESAKKAIESAECLSAKGQYRESISEYERAQKLISEAKGKASDSEKKKLKEMDEGVSKSISEVRVLDTKKGEPKVKPVDTSNQIKAEDPEEVRKREAAEKKKKEDEETAKRNAKIDADAKRRDEAMKGAKKTTKDEDETPPAAANPAAKPGEAAAEGEGDGEGPDKAAKGGVIAKALGPYAAVTKDTPEFVVAKLEKRGKYVMAFIQIFNKLENERRISGVATYFKDGDNALLIDERQVIAYQYDGFKAAASDPTTQDCPGLTMGSHTVPEMNVLRFVVVAEHNRAADVKKVGVNVSFQDDGKSIAGVGPDANAPAAPAEAGPGSIIKGGKK
jgi:hypothetical protein